MFPIIFFNAFDFENNFSLETVNLACSCTDSGLMSSNKEALETAHLSAVVTDHWERAVTGQHLAHGAGGGDGEG